MEAAPKLAHGAFYRSLLSHSHPSFPISKAIYTPDDPSYPCILQAYIRNLRFNTSTTPKPLLILTALHESHVQAAVICAKKHGLQMKIRSGGHDYEGSSYVSDVPFFILDMCNLRSIDIDIENETAWVQTGATLGELFYRIAEKSSTHGFPAGVCPTVGVGGHFIGGGYGNMMRKYGLSVDNIVDAILVDAEGRILDRKSMGEDLFWAIRGGGASFGVVLSYKINLVQVTEIVTVFRVERTLEENANDIVYQWQHVAHKIDEDLFIRLLLDVVKDSGSGEKTLRASFIGFFLGDSERLLSVATKSFPELRLLKSDCIETSWLESILFWADFPIGTPIDVMLSRTPPSSVHLKRKSDYVQKPISKDCLVGIWKKMIELEVPKMGFNPYGGKMSEISEASVPFPHRAGNLWKIQYQINWNEEGAEAVEYHLDLARQLYSYMTPFVSKNPRAAFLNYKDLDLGINHHGKASYSEGSSYGISYFKDNFKRLVKIKTKVDPGNLFRHEQSVPTASLGRM
ncbi:berberine bridge enzyme [Salix suchowensis]|nr:berberine bridge enzyme [Salix suchowensis]